jgi:pimeloyl-ACP methyl ester carboxylesterase
MLGLSRTRWLLGLAFVFTLVSMKPAHGQNKPDPINFETGDGVKIVGTFWPSSKGKKAPVVMLLHDFKYGKGGNSKADGWNSLAEALNKEGYAVLAFDFRGHGNSTSVTNAFWMPPNVHNIKGMKAPPNPAKLPETISHTGFLPSYYPQFVNDIAAAKAFLDRKNDGAELNSSNLIVIGAGEGATLGAIWMVSEWQKARATQGVGMVGAPKLHDPEGKDFVCAVWLDISPTVAGAGMPYTRWCVDLGKTHKMPMGFVYGKEVKTSDERAARVLGAIIPNFERGKPAKDPAYEFTGEKALPTKLTGSQLLHKELDTEKFIVQDYLKVVMDKHQVTEWRSKDSQMSKQYWIFPNMLPHPAKMEGELAPLPIPVSRFIQ